MEYIPKEKRYEWSRFRALARLDRKYDDTLTEYFRAFYAMCKRVCGKPLAKDEEMLPYFVEPITEERARRCLERVDLLNKIREEILYHPDLDKRLQLCQSSMDLPDWWISGKHDKELLIGAAKHGLSHTDYHILHDPELSFLEVLKNYTQSKGMSEESEQLKMLFNPQDKLTAEDEGSDVNIETKYLENAKTTTIEKEEPVDKDQEDEDKTEQEMPSSKDVDAEVKVAEVKVAEVKADEVKEAMDEDEPKEKSERSNG